MGGPRAFGVKTGGPCINGIQWMALDLRDAVVNYHLKLFGSPLVADPTAINGEVEYE